MVDHLIEVNVVVVLIRVRECLDEIASRTSTHRQSWYFTGRQIFFYSCRASKAAAIIIRLLSHCWIHALVNALMMKLIKLLLIEGGRCHKNYLTHRLRIVLIGLSKSQRCERRQGLCKVRACD